MGKGQFNNWEKQVFSPQMMHRLPRAVPLQGRLPVPVTYDWMAIQ